VASKSFKVEDYVLPRFELTVTPPAYLLGSDENLKLKACVRYVFGQPVQGTLKVTVKNNGYSRYRMSQTFLHKISGCKDLSIPVASMINVQRWYTAYDSSQRSSWYKAYRITVDLEFEEDGTGNTEEKTVDVQIKRTALTIKDEAEDDRIAKPNLPTSVYMTATFPDGSPAANEPMNVCLKKTCRTISTNNVGILHFVVPPDFEKTDEQSSQRIDVTSVNYGRKTLKGGSSYMYESRGSTNIYFYHTDSDAALTIYDDPAFISCSGTNTLLVDITVLFAANGTTAADLYVQALSRGQIQYWNKQRVVFRASDLGVDEDLLLAPLVATPGVTHGTFNVRLELPLTVSPKVKVLIWYTRSDGEVIAHHQTINIAKCLTNRVSLKWSEDKVKQGSRTDLTLSAAPSSLCSLGVVDKSVALMASSQPRLTLHRIFQLAEGTFAANYENSPIDDDEYCENQRDSLSRQKRRIGRTSYSWETYARDTIYEFAYAGMHVITDLTIETRECTRRKHYYHWWGGFGRSAGGGMRLRGHGGGDMVMGMAQPMAVMARPSTGAVQMESVAVRDDSAAEAAEETRTYFPETWLWDLIQLPENGQQVQQLTLPDTITTWIGDAVCVHPTAGVGLSGQASVTAFTTFFLDITLLATIKMGETMPVVISVFNYLDDTLPVRLELEASTEYEILGSGVRYFCIAAGEKATATISIKLLAVGEVNVTVKAQVEDIVGCRSAHQEREFDRVIRPVIVDFEGFPREITHSSYSCLPSELGEIIEWALAAPANIVPDSARAYITVVGDLLGPTLENLKHLVKMPYGCGEQNLLGLVPNIFVMHYLEASGQNNDATKEELLRNMRAGYQRELKYRHDDGSYSAFGTSDNEGSTWLSAFVLKSYAQASEYITVDTAEIALTKAYLTGLQQPDGCFQSRGRVIHKGMKGGVGEGNRPRLLAAYIVVSLLEAGEPASGATITNAISCLIAGGVSNDAYEASQIAYALALAVHSDASTWIRHLLTLRNSDSTGSYFNIPASYGKGVGVETAGYALMAMVTFDQDEFAAEEYLLVKWISAQRNSQGGFISTQDTVVALQALAVFEEGQPQGGSALTIVATGNGFTTTFSVTESNRLLTQRADVPTLPNNVVFSLSGTGCALVQAVVRYNIYDKTPSEAFQMTVETFFPTNDCRVRRIRICATYLPRDDVTNMAIIEVNLESGNIPLKKDLKAVVASSNGAVKRYEIDGNQVLFYVNELSHDSTCVEFSVNQEIIVENVKPGTITVYDYYDPDLSISQDFTLPRNENRELCRPKPQPRNEGRERLPELLPMPPLPTFGPLPLGILEDFVLEERRFG